MDSYYKQCCDEHWGTRVSFNSGFLSVYAQQWDCWVIRQFYEGNPVDEGTTRRDTDIPMYRLEKPADSTHSSKCGLSPREQLERQVKLHSFTQDEALPSWPNSSGTLRSESEMETNPEVPASTRAFTHFSDEKTEAPGDAVFISSLGKHQS